MQVAAREQFFILGQGASAVLVPGRVFKQGLIIPGRFFFVVLPRPIFILLQFSQFSSIIQFVHTLISLTFFLVLEQFAFALVVFCIALHARPLVFAALRAVFFLIQLQPVFFLAQGRAVFPSLPFAVLVVAGKVALALFAQVQPFVQLSLIQFVRVFLSQL